MKRIIAFGLLSACSDPSSTTVPCQQNTCADFHHEMAPVCGSVYDGCGKNIDCGPCDASDLGGGGGAESSSSASATTSSSTSSGSTSSGESQGEGGTNMCEDLVFEK